MISYGVLRGEPCHVAASARFFRGITRMDSWLVKWFRDAGIEARRALYGGGTGLIANGTRHARVHATYPVTQIQPAVTAAGAGERFGKILVTGGDATGRSGPRLAVRH